MGGCEWNASASAWLPKRRASGWWAVTLAVSFRRLSLTGNLRTSLQNKVLQECLYPGHCGLIPLESFLEFCGRLLSKTPKCCSEASRCGRCVLGTPGGRCGFERPLGVYTTVIIPLAAQASLGTFSQGFQLWDMGNWDSFLSFTGWSDQGIWTLGPFLFMEAMPLIFPWTSGRVEF